MIKLRNSAGNKQENKEKYEISSRKTLSNKDFVRESHSPHKRRGKTT